MEEKRRTGMVEDEELEDSENIIINAVDGLPNLHPNLEQLELEFDRERRIGDSSIRSIDELVHDEDLPTSVIVTNVDPRVFKGDELKVINKQCKISKVREVTEKFPLHQHHVFTASHRKSFQAVWGRCHVSILQILQKNASELWFPQCCGECEITAASDTFWGNGY